jgi:hypothetical protein
MAEKVEGAAVMAKSSKLGPTASVNDVNLLLKHSIGELRSVIQAEREKFFPNGIELLEISIDIFNIKAAFKIAGPKATQFLSVGEGAEVVRTR